MRVWKRGDPGIPADARFIGRPSNHGNPYIIGRDGTRDEVIAEFEKYARGRLKREPYWLDSLVGHDLVCFCHPEACHGDVIIKLIKERQARNAT